VFHETELAKSINIIRINVEALTRMTKLFLTDMVARNSGKILNIGSIAGFEPGPLAAVYHATEAYILSFSEAIAEEIKQTNVKITVICPGPTDTDFFGKANMEDIKAHEKAALMEPQEVANIGYEALLKGELVVVPGLHNKLTSVTHRFVPSSVQAKKNRKYYEGQKPGNSPK
jgi:short-subunit dehydrogenase